MRQGKSILLALSGIFLLLEIIFNYLILTVGGGDLLEAYSKTFVFLLFILLFSKKLTWAKWTLSVLLVLYGVLCLLAAYDFAAIFYLIGLYNIFFGIYIHKSKALEIFRTTKIHSDQLVNTSPLHTSPVQEAQKYEYPLLVRRYKALLIDGLLGLAILVIIMLLVQDSEIRTPILVSSALILSLIYEPVLTAYSKTIGQRIMRIRVGTHADPLARISLTNAYIRWFTKGLLGWLSFITILFNTEKRAIHDIASDSVMIMDTKKHQQ